MLNRESLSLLFELRNKNHFPCFDRVMETLVKVYENKKCCGNASRRRLNVQNDEQCLSCG